jgi:ethanolamine utilization protein EutA (predicted chaperonin)
MTEEGAEGGRIFFSSTGRSLVDEDEIVVLSVGVDIGSSTSHLMFSRITLERLDSRHVVSAREVLFQSEILLTPYCGADEIAADALGGFIDRQYREAGVDPEEIDTGALILTGVAVRRRNARRIGELFARHAGRMVAVSAGDSLETIMAAHGSGAAARSIRDNAVVMNVDVGGGTSKIAICADGRVVDLTALDVGARLVCLDPTGRIARIEDAGRRFAAEVGLVLDIGAALPADGARALASRMADRLFEAMDGGSPVAGGRGLLRLDPLARRGEVAEVTFSGGVAEYINGREAASHGDLGMLLAQEIRARVGSWGPRLACAGEGIRATVIGASQYTMQVSGSTIYVSPLDTLPLRNLPVVAPDFALDSEEIATPAVADAITAMLKRLDLDAAGAPVAVFVRWRGSATFQRLDAFCRGVADGLASILADGHPLVLAGDGDVGGLMGIHMRNEMQIDNAIVSVDGLELKEFDYVDIGAMLPGSGAVPVVIKSLIFPANQSP